MSRSSSLQMDRSKSVASSRSSARLHLSGGSRSLKGIGETLSAAMEASTVEKDERNDKMYVAVAKEFKAGKEHLVWVLKNNPTIKKIVLIHVHVPSPVVPMKGAWFPANQLEPEEVKAYRQIEQETMQRALNEYIDGCSNFKEMQVEKLVVEADDIGQGLLQLISQHRITNLVMGAAADKHYMNNMKEPKSRKALMLQRQAASLCKIWFVCKGNLICTREAELYGSGKNARKDIPPRQSESNLKSSPQIHGKYLSFYLNTTEDSLKKRPLSITSAPNNESKMGTFVQEKYGYPSNPDSTGEIVIDLLEGISKGSGSSMKSVNEKIFSNTSSIRILENEEMEGEPFILPLEDSRLDDELYKDLKHAVTEAKNLTKEAYEQSMGCQKAERDLHEAAQKAKATKQRREIEARLSLEKRELEELKKQLGEMFEELQEAHEQIESLELQLADSRKTSRDLKKKLSDTHYLLISLQHKYVELRSERDDAIREAELLRQKIMEMMADDTHGTELFTEFSYSQLEQATNNFDPSLKVGEGGYGSVYKGVLCQKTVAIKMLNSEGMQGQKEFHKEVNVLSRLRHANLVRLIGVCPEAWALVYDFLPNGSLEDRLNRKDNTPPLPWPLRLRIAIEICAALVFLHSNPDLTVVHGDLKPANILLGADFVTKLADFGISGLLQASNNSTALYRCTHAMGTFVYMDPEFLASGDLTPRSDVYSLGIIILQMLTGRPAFGINRSVQDAVEGECLSDLLDAAAGEWPRGKAEQLAQLGLRCCAIVRKSRPDAREALRLLEAVANSPTPASSK